MEKGIERKFKEIMERHSTIVLGVDRGCIFKVVKFVSPGNTGVPDRMVLGPDGFVAFVEFKQPGKKPTPKQEWWLERLRDMDHYAFWSDNATSAAITVRIAYEAHVLRLSR